MTVSARPALRTGSIAFPAISCGVYGYPLPLAAAVAVETVVVHAAGIEVLLCCYGGETFTAFTEALGNAT